MKVSFETFAQQYVSMPDEDIERLSQDLRSLMPEARRALRAEMERRRIPTENFDWSDQPTIPKPKKSGGKGIRRFLFNISILVAFDFILALVRNSQRIDVHGLYFFTLFWSLQDGLEGALRPSYLIIAFLTAAQFSSRKAESKRSFGMIAQLTLVLVFSVSRLPSLDSIWAELLWILAITWIVLAWWRLPE